MKKLHMFSLVTGGTIIAEVDSKDAVSYHLTKAVSLVPQRLNEREVNIGVATITMPLGDGDFRKQPKDIELNRSAVVLTFDISEGDQFKQTREMHANIFPPIIISPSAANFSLNR